MIKKDLCLDSHLLAPFLMSLPSFVREKMVRDKLRHSSAVGGLLKLSKTKSNQISHWKGNLSLKHPLFYPKEALQNCAHSFSNGFNIGFFKVFCTRSCMSISLTSFDHGQYPWGRHQHRGAMAFLCKSLGIASFARNTCLPTHLLIGLIYFKILSLEEILSYHRPFVKNMLSSQHMREDIPTIMSFLKRFQLKNKVCFRSVVFIPDQGFVLLSRYFGNISKQNIFLIHRHQHFFLGLEI